MIIEILIDDIILYITTFLDDINKIYFLSSNKILHTFKNKIYYDEMKHITKIYNLSYYDMFKNIQVDGLDHKLPKYVTHLSFEKYSTFDEDIRNKIPNTITHLTFGPCFDQNIKGCISNSVTASLTSSL